MIGFNHIGTIGRFGNQMFQYAALRGIAAHRGFNFVFPPPYDSVDNYGIHDCFKLINVTEDNINFHPSQQYVQEGQFHFNEKLFDNCPDNINLYGFYQTMKYFAHIEEQIRQDFSFKDYIIDPCLEMMESFDTRPEYTHQYRYHEGYWVFHNRVIVFLLRSESPLLVLFRDNPC